MWSHWGPSQPVHRINGQNCVVYSSGNRWDDVSCSVQRDFLCDLPVDRGSPPYALLYIHTTDIASYNISISSEHYNVQIFTSIIIIFKFKYNSTVFRFYLEVLSATGKACITSAVRKAIHSVKSFIRCQTLCVRESDFVCQSFVYVNSTQTCKLYTVTNNTVTRDVFEEPCNSTNDAETLYGERNLTGLLDFALHKLFDNDYLVSYMHTWVKTSLYTY